MDQGLKPRLLIVTSHPIQYQAPWFRALHEDGRLDLQVLFLSLPDPHEQGVGFGHAFEWDVPLLEGYSWQVAPSASGNIRAGWWGLYLRSAQNDLAVYKPDVVLLTGWQNRGMLQCLRSTRKLRLPLLLRAESNGLEPLTRIRQLKNRWIVSAADQLLPIGTANRRYYEKLGLAERLGPEAAYFVDSQFFASRADEAGLRSWQLRRRFGIPEDAFCFLFVGKFVEKKRPGDILQAMAKLAKIANRELHLLMVGTGPLEVRLQGQVATENLPVTFAGFLNQSEIPQAYAVADCLVLPSDYGETWGLVVNEAMACGLPAIVSDRVGCGLDLVISGETGFIFRFGDIVHLAQRMADMANLADFEHGAMGERAREHVFTHYSIERAVEATVAATLQLMSEQPAKAPH